jgi:predicted kinase
MKSKLIILNGPCGIGKSTLADMYKNEHPMCLMLDIDEVRRFMGSYREHQEQSYEQMYKLAYAMTREHLQNGYDVIVAKFIAKADVLRDFEKIAQECDANFFEFVLFSTKEDALARAVKRGFKPGGLLQADKLEKMYDELVEILKQRPKAIQIVSREDRVTETYRELIEKL